MLLTLRVPPSSSDSSQLFDFFFFFIVNYDNDVYSALSLTNMVLVYVTKAGPFFAASLSTLSTKRSEDK